MTDDALISIKRLTKDLATASITLSDKEARFLVDAYYSMQHDRIRYDGQLRSMAEEPHEVISWFAGQAETLENQIKRALDKYSQAHIVGKWLRSVKGIGPVISAGLLAHIDITKAPTAGHIWSFAGMDPNRIWEKGEKRPWNAALKVICWKAGESFVKLSNNDECVYGQLYIKKKKYYLEKNEAGEFKIRAGEILEKKKFDKTTDAYKAYIIGKLPPGHIHAMARRYAVKIFLSHLHGEMYRRILNQEPPVPFAIAILGHAHMIEGPK